jgi:phospholipid/cholesterol/gamma-HCH transport system ATP-binding protein
MNSKLVEVKDLTTGYNDQTVLKNIDMTAYKEQVTTVLGTSGCGKTTLLKNMIRLYEPWSGSIRLFGREITAMDESELNRLLEKTGVLFQNGALLNSITVAENVAVPLEQHTSLSKELIDRLVKLKLSLVGLGDTLNHFPSQLSGGMRKRAALARAIVMDPPLLFCDEPSAGLDPVTAASLDQLIARLRDDLGMTIVIITHAVASIKRIADRVVFLDAGEVLFSGTLKEARACGVEKIDRFFALG